MDLKKKIIVWISGVLMLLGIGFLIATPFWTHWHQSFFSLLVGIIFVAWGGRMALTSR